MAGSAPAALSAGDSPPRRLFFYNAGFLRQPRLRRILTLAGHSLQLGLPGPGDGVVVWGRSPHAHRGETVAARRGAPLIRVEDAFLRSIRPGRAGEAGLGLMIDGEGVHFDSSTPSRLERILARDPLDATDILARAGEGIERMRQLHLSKYNLYPLSGPLPDPGYVLVVDQTQDDASIRHGGARAASFAEMLVLALEENPGKRILIKTHPETALGLRPGHFTATAARDRVAILTDPVSPWALLDGAIAVYTVSSQLGFEAILAGHRPVVLGQPFYAGWGLSDDRNPVPRRRRMLTRRQLFAGAMILAPTWYDPCRDRLCSFEQALDQIEAELRAFREDQAGHVAIGMRLWKRPHLQRFFGEQKPVLFRNDPQAGADLAARTGRGILVWGASADPPAARAGKRTGDLPSGPVALRRIEDGFLRSRGLGANLVPPLSLVSDDLGIYYDPGRESRLERLIRAPLPPGGLARARALRARLIDDHLSKYNLGPRHAFPDLPPGHRILVAGQVEDDASIRLGAGEVRRNLDLLRAARAARPDALIVYKPHPDVEAGLRAGAITLTELEGLADLVAEAADPVTLIEMVDEVWTMTSLLGFEALIRGKPVTTLGAPFYAGWGLTRDLGPVPDRRRRAADGHPLPRPDLDVLVHAALIGYPRYRDPISGRPCPPEVVLDRLAAGQTHPSGPVLRGLAKLQGALASQSWIWRG